MTRCNICGKRLKNGDSLVAHIKREHRGLSERSIRYLLSIGVSVEKIRSIE